MHRKTLWICLLALGLAAAPAAAQDEAAEYDRVGFYLSAQGQYAFPNFGAYQNIKALGSILDSLALPVVPGSQSSGAWGAGARVGFRTSPRVAVEGQFEWFDEFRLQSRYPDAAAENGVAQSTIGKFREFTASANAKVFVLTGRFQPYVLGGIGAGFLKAEPRANGNTVKSVGFIGRVGAGADVYVTRNVALFAEATYVFATGNLSSLDIIPIAIGVSWRF